MTTLSKEGLIVAQTYLSKLYYITKMEANCIVFPSPKNHTVPEIRV